MKILRILFSIGIFISIWAFFSNELISSPKQSFEAILELGKLGTLQDGLKDSLVRYILGLSIGVIFGVIFGVILGFMPRLNAFINPVLDLLRPISPIAWVPVVVIIFGIGDKPTIFIIAYAVFFPVVLLSINALKQVPRELVLISKNFGANAWQLFYGVYFPSCIFTLVSALKLGASLAWINLVVGEMVGAQTGLGYLITDARNQLEIPTVLGLIFIIGIIGMTINALFNTIELYFTKRFGYDKNQ